MTLAIGVLSGTSADGIDAALVRVGAASVRVVRAATFPYRSETRALIGGAAALSAPSIAELHRAIGEEFALAVNGLMERAGIARRKVVVIGSHGQTVVHLPKRMSLQLGAPAVIAERTGIPVAADFRIDDIAAGGEGAPLVPLLDHVLLAARSRKRRLATLNIGGISNITVLDRGKVVAAYDTGPGNGMIDAAMRWRFNKAFDQNGEVAARGRYSPRILEKSLLHRYFHRAAPKSTGLEEFGEEWMKRLVGRTKISGADLVTTMTVLSAITIARDLLLRNVSEVWISGGGAKNRTLRKFIEQFVGLGRSRGREHDAGIQWRKFQEIGLDPDFREAALFALLGVRRLKGMASDLRVVTGSRRPKILGGLWEP